jgi:hypothetical protein
MPVTEPAETSSRAAIALVPAGVSSRSVAKIALR